MTGPVWIVLVQKGERGRGKVAHGSKASLKPSAQI